jgi:hypothetical protein
MPLDIIKQEIYTGSINIRAHSCDSPISFSVCPHIWQHRTCPCIGLVVSIFLLILRSLCKVCQKSNDTDFYNYQSF